MRVKIEYPIRLLESRIGSLNSENEKKILKSASPLTSLPDGKPK